MNRSHLTARVLMGSILSASLCAPPIAAQVVPDVTLPVGERSQVIGNPNVQIDGGARRGGNLFHSFSQFSIPTGGSAYFNNAADVQNIFSRVTGGASSTIDGLIRANGTANLFLLNPNGILFGPNARLNIGGSFVASTGDRFQFADGSEFSAVNPQAPPLLTVNVTAGLQYGRSSPDATITNRGILAVEQDLTLSANKLDLQGQLQAGRDLSLLAQDTVQIRDTAIAPVVVQAGRNLTIQGNQGIDILALNHPSQPALVSGGNLSLISDGVISGDARFASDGRFSLRSVSGGLANFVSLYDPIIGAGGDIDVAANYTGTSLLVESQGNIRLQGNITITGPDTSGLPPGLDTETLRTSSALIVRSGQSALAYGGVNSGATPASNKTNAIPTGITLGGNVVLQPFNGAGGIVNLTTGTGNISTQAISTNGGVINITSAGSITSNQQLLDTSNGANNGGSITVSANGDITTGRLVSSSFSNAVSSGSGGNVAVTTTNGNITIGITSALSSSSASSGRGGDVTVSTANGNINGDFIFSFSSAGSGNSGGGGTIALSAANGGITAGRLYSYSNSRSGSAGNGGQIVVNATNGNIKADIILSSSSSISGAARNAGDVTLRATNGSIATSNISAFTRVNNRSAPLTGSGTSGNGGAITLTATGGDVSTARLESNVFAERDAGNGGAIWLFAPDGKVTTREWIYSGSFSNAGRGGKGGDISLIAGGTIQPFQFLPGSRGNTSFLSTINSTGSQGGNITINAQAPFIAPSFLISSDTFGAGRGGDVQITAPSILFTGAAQISASTHSSGQGGNITLRATDSIELIGATPTNPFGTSLQSGFAGLPAGTYVGGYIPTGGNSSAATGSAFEVPAGTVFPTGAFTQTTVGATGNAGNLIIETGRLIIQDGAALATTTFGQNSNAGSISILARESVSLANGRILSGVAGGAIGNSGEINITTPSLTVTDGIIQTQTLGQGRAGDVQITAPNGVSLSGIDSGVRSSSGGGNTLLGTTGNNSGQGGDIHVTTDTLTVTDGAALNAQTQTNSRGGDIVVNADRLNLATGGQLLTSTASGGQAGNITVQTPDLQLAGVTSGLFAGTTSSGDAGNLTIQPRGNGQRVRVNLQDGAQISASTSSSGQGGDLLIAAPESITLTGNGSVIAAGTGGSGAGGNLNLRTNTLNIQNQAEVTVSSVGTGSAGSLFVDANQIYLDNQGSIRAGTTSSGAGGNLNLRTKTLNVQNQSEVTVSSAGRGSAGSLFVNADQIYLDNQGSIRADTSGSGAGGNLNLRTRNLNIQNQAEVTVSSSGSGTAGNLFVDADRILLNDQGSIRADTTGGGGNINLRSPFILLRNGSNITTNARGANIPGGNITIDTRFLIAVLNEDSNISANSEDFRGGNINIKAFSIFGIQPRPTSTPLSDITATGITSALSGTINVITAGIDPTAGLVALPTDLVDASGLIAQGCPANQGNSFVMSGRGGLPPTPEQQLDDDAGWSDRRRLMVGQQPSDGAGARSQKPEASTDSELRTRNLELKTFPDPPHRSAERSRRSPTPNTPIVEATGWQITPTGEIFLIATTPDPAIHNPLNQLISCQGRR